MSKTNDIKTNIVNYLGSHGITAWVHNNGAAKIGGRYIRFGKTSIPDIIGYTKSGRFIAVEVKNPETNDKLSDGQAEKIYDMLQSGCLAFVAESVFDVECYLMSENII